MQRKITEVFHAELDVVVDPFPVKLRLLAEVVDCIHVRDAFGDRHGVRNENAAFELG